MSTPMVWVLPNATTGAEAAIAEVKTLTSVIVSGTLTSGEFQIEVKANAGWALVDGGVFDVSTIPSGIAKAFSLSNLQAIRVVINTAIVGTVTVEIV